MKNLKLKPSQRDNRRYFIADASNEQMEKAILEYLGVLGFAKSAYMPVKQGNRLIGSVKREELEKVRAALAFKGISIKKVSGTIKGLK